MRQKPHIFLFILLIFLLVLFLYLANAERLPVVGGDNNTWGDILLGFLNVSIGQNGTLKGDIINSTHIINGTIMGDDISSGANLTIAKINLTGTGNSTISGNLVLNGTLFGASPVKIQGLNITNNELYMSSIATSNSGITSVLRRGSSGQVITGASTGLFVNESNGFIGININPSINNTLTVNGTANISGNLTFGKLRGHLSSIGSAPSVFNCGTGSPSVQGTDVAGTITTGTLATSCSLSFVQPYITPSCIVTSSSSSAILSINALNTTTLEIGLSVSLTSGKIYYHCYELG